MILLGSITADTFLDALFGQWLPRKLERFIRFMRKRAQVSLAGREGDADGKNVRLMAYEVTKLAEEGVLHSFFPCGIHQGNHGVGDVVEEVGRHICDALFAYGKLVREGNYWTRNVLAVEVVIHGRLDIKYEEPPPFCAEMVTLLVDLFYPVPLPKNGKPPSPQALAKYHEEVKEFQTMCNGNPFSDTPTHYCHPSVGCNCVSPAHTKRRHSKAMVRSLYNRRPRPPQVKEWTVVSESSSWAAFGVMLNGMHRKVFEVATNRIPANAVAGRGHLSLVPALRPMLLVRIPNPALVGRYV